MGFGLGAAIGSCLATGKKTVLFTGDGSFGMNLNELATVSKLNAPIVIFIMNNGVLGMVRQWQTLFYGQRYSYTMNETADFNGDGQKGNSVMYIPTAAEIGQMDWASAGDAAKFEQFIRADKYLSSHRGQWSERYAGTSPFEHHFDLHIAQDFYYDKKHGRKLQFIVDFLNISNLFNREWGLYYSGAYNLQILNVTGVTSDASGNITPTYKFSPDELYLSDFYSRWRCQLGFRLTF